MSARIRFRIEAALAALATLFLILTLVWGDWIEIVFGIDPDHGDGSAEWLVAGAAALVAIAFGVLARLDLRRIRAAAA